MSGEVNLLNQDAVKPKKQRIYKYDNVKALLILLVVLGHMFTDYVSDNMPIRAMTLWIYTFHMPAFIFISGLMHKELADDAKFRRDKFFGFLACAYALKIFNFAGRNLIGQNPAFHVLSEAGIPWFLIVMAWYELIFFMLRGLDGKKVIVVSMLLSMFVGYDPEVGDFMCLARTINFLPIFALGYYTNPRTLLEWSKKKWLKACAYIVTIGTFAASFALPFGAYSLRKLFTGRRSYEFLQEFIDGAIDNGWWMRLAAWIFAMVLTISIIVIIPDRKLGYITTIGARTMNIYFWHRLLCYAFVQFGLFEALVGGFGGSLERGFLNIGAVALYTLIGIFVTWLFSLKIFEHPTSELMKLTK